MRTEELLSDISRFNPIWADDWQPAPGMLDFEEKWESFHNPTGRLMVCAHRGDYNIYYPENSLEGCLSAILAGADMLEVDLKTTLDGELVLMHDPTLTRTTNLSLLREAGEDWMPASDVIADWTLREIRRLRLMLRGEVTEYAVPTLRELIRIAKDRVFITLDHVPFFKWEDAYALIREQRAYRTVLIPYNYNLETVYAIQCQVRRQTGYNLPFFAGVVIDGSYNRTKHLYEVMEFLKAHDMPPILRGTYHNIEDVERITPFVESIRKDHRIYSESMGRYRDNPDTWQSMLDMGYNIFMGNKLYEFMKIVKQRHFSET